MVKKDELLAKSFLENINNHVTLQPQNFLDMYAIVEIQGQQFKVEAGKKVYVHRLPGNVGDLVSFDKVLLTQNGSDISVGAPIVSGVKVNAKILNHLKDDKVTVFKKKRRKGYKLTKGHRQALTQIAIESIG
jgi:large subunit ribosomal protein L21